MSAKRLLVLAAAVLLGYWLYTHRGGTSSSSATRPTSSGGAAAPSGADAFDCLRKAEEANGRVHDSVMAALRPPVDASAWNAAESGTLSAISEAESACGSGGSEAEQAAVQEVRSALGAMRSLVSDFSATVRGAGGGGVSDAPSRQADIDARLDRARGLLGKRA